MIHPVADGVNRFERNQLFLKMDEKAVDLAYGSKIKEKDSCAMWWMPFRNTDWAFFLRRDKDKQFPKKYKLVREMLLATPRAPSIVSFTQEFTRKVLKGS